MDSIRIVAEIELKAGQKAALLPTLKNLVEGSRAEPGNISYDLTEDIEREGHFFVIEEWRSAQAIEEHNATAHFQAFAAAVAGKTEKRVLTKLKNLF